MWKINLQIEYNQKMRDDLLEWLESSNHPDRDRHMFLIREDRPDLSAVAEFILSRAGFSSISGKEGRDYIGRPEADRHLTIDQVARICNVSSRTVTRWKDSGKIGYVKLADGAIRISYQAMTDFLETYRKGKAGG